MADHSKPVLTSTYANFVTELDARFDDLAVGLDPALVTPTNLPNNSIGWSSAENKWKKWNLTAWGPLSTSYDLDIANGSIVDSPISGSTGSFTTLAASGAFSLTGDQVQVSEGGTGATTAAGARTNLGLVIGTNVQAYDAELAALAGLTSAADKLPYFSGAGTAALATFPAFSRTVVGGVDAAAWKVALALGNVTNTSDANKPVSTAQQAALDLKANLTAASATGAGLVELATNAESAAGADTTRAVTPAGLAAAFAGGLNFYTGTVTTNLAFPVGSVLVVGELSGVDRNQVKSVYLAAPGGFQFSVNGTPLTGTWRTRGAISNGALVQRTA